MPTQGLMFIYQIDTTMAKAIKETPILIGEDATRFRKEMECITPASKKRKCKSHLRSSIKE